MHSTICAESFAVDNKDYVYHDIATKVVGTFVSNDNKPTLKYENKEGVCRNPC